MRCLTWRRPRRDLERGATAVMVAIMAPVLIAAVGLSVDGGNLVLQRANVQKAADSAAMAIGQDCAGATRPGLTSAQLSALLTKCSPGGATATAQTMTATNAPGATAAPVSVLNATQSSLTISVSKRVPLTLGSAVGARDQTVRASATVTWSQVPTAATTFPLGMNVCDYNAWRRSPSSTPRLYRYDIYQDNRGLITDAQTCASPSGGTDRSIYGGLWLISELAPWFSESGCRVATSIGITGTVSSTNILFPGGCSSRVRNEFAVNKTVLLPIFDSPTFLGSRVSTTLFPRIRGYAPFVLTGWRIGGFLGLFGIETGGSVPSSCTGFLGTGSCRGVQGYFTGSIIPREEVDTYGSFPGADFGSVRVKLTN